MSDEGRAHLWSSGIENLNILNVLSILNILKTPPPSHLNLRVLFANISIHLPQNLCGITSEYSVPGIGRRGGLTCGLESGKQARKEEEEMEEEKQERLRGSKRG